MLPTTLQPAQFTIKGLLVEQIRNEIILGNFPPGTRLRLRNLAKQFDVSVQPIREALGELETEGLVQTIAHKGSIVTTLSAEDIVDIYETRATLEALATRLAIPKMSADTFKKLTQIVDQMDASFGQVAELINLNRQFHYVLYQASQRKHLCETINILRNRTSHYLHAYMIQLDAMTERKDDHRIILKRAAAGDIEGTASFIYDHIAHAGEGIARYVEKQNEFE